MKRHRSISVAMALEELDANQIEATVVPRGKHVEIKWTYNGHAHSVITANTPSDHRGPLNARAMVRRLIRADKMEESNVAI